jgi:branched-chain amino acid transport system ATP-binding protein
MNDQAVIDAYLGAHHDTDLGTLTGQMEIAEGMESALVKEEIESDLAAQEAEESAEATDAAEPTDPSAKADDK